MLFLAFAYTQSFPADLVRGGDRGRHAGGPRNSAADAHPERALQVPRAGRARPHVRLSGRAGRLAAVSDVAGAEAGAGALARSCSALFNAGVALWSTYLFREQLGARSRTARRGAWRCWRCSARDGFRRAHLVGRRQQPLRRRSDLQPQHALPAHRADALEGRPAPVPELAPAVQLARRVSLPRSAGASRTGRACRARGGCWCWAAATAWRCAKS